MQSALSIQGKSLMKLFIRFRVLFVFFFLREGWGGWGRGGALEAVNNAALAVRHSRLIVMSLWLGPPHSLWQLNHKTSQIVPHGASVCRPPFRPRCTSLPPYAMFHSAVFFNGTRLFIFLQSLKARFISEYWISAAVSCAFRRHLICYQNKVDRSVALTLCQPPGQGKAINNEWDFISTSPNLLIWDLFLANSPLKALCM